MQTFQWHVLICISLQVHKDMHQFYAEHSKEIILTHHPLDKMAAILTDGIFKCFFVDENDRIPIQISLKFVSRSQIDNKLALVQVKAWRRTGDKPLSEPMLTQLTDA